MCQKASQQGRIYGETDRSPSSWQTAGISHTCSIILENLWFLRDCVGLAVLCTYDHWLPVCVRKDRSPIAVWSTVTLRSISQGDTSCLMTSVGIILASVCIRVTVAAEIATIFLTFSPPINLSLLGDSWRKCQLLLKPSDGYRAHIPWSLKQKIEGNIKLKSHSIHQ